MRSDKKTFKDVDEYIKTYSPKVAVILKTIRRTVKKAVPDAEEVISYQMPAFKYHGMLVYYAAFTNHYSLFIPRVVKFFEEELSGYETSKATIKIPFGKPVPVRLISKMVKYSAKLNLEAADLKSNQKKARR